jgi:hypothetical protein
MTTTANEMDATEQTGDAPTTGTTSSSASVDNSAAPSTAAVSRSSSPPQSSPLLDLPAELRVMVYEHCFTTEYKKLPLGHYRDFSTGEEYEIEPVYWRSFAIPVGLMATC